MILIQFILVAAFLLGLFSFLNSPASNRSRAWTKLLTIAFTLAAISAIIFPHSANAVAHFLGVGRGADLLLYLLTLVFIYTVLYIYIRGKKTDRELTTLARKIAVITAIEPSKNKK